MISDASEEQIAAAQAYEEFFVPALFQQWASRVLDAVGIEPGERVLDVACGTGVLAREATRSVEATGVVVGVDIAEGMLAVAQQLAPEIEWRQGSADTLPAPDESFDVAVCQFGLMFFPDHTAAVREMLRVLRPGGRLAIAVWESLDQIPAIAKEVAVLERVAGMEAANALRAPFVLGDADELKRLAEDAGTGSADVRTYEGRAVFPSIRWLVEADLRGWLPIMGVVLPEGQIAEVLDEAERELAEYVTPEGQMSFAMPAHILSGTKS